MALLLTLPCVQVLALPRGGLRLEPARPAAAANSASVAASRFAIQAGCGRLFLLPPAAKAGSGLRLERGGRATANAMGDIPAELAKQIDAAAVAYGHDASLLLAIVRVESAFNPLAVSPKGALGLMQIMPKTATGLGIADPPRDLLDPAINLRAGARHLRALRNRYPDSMELAIAAYNAGEGAVARWAGIPPYAETQAYVKAVLDWRGRYQRNQAIAMAASAPQAPPAPPAPPRVACGRLGGQ